MPPGGASIDRQRFPAEKTAYALRDVESLARRAEQHGDAVGQFAAALLAGAAAVDADAPASTRSSASPVAMATPASNAACDTALAVDMLSVRRLARMLELGTPPPRPPPARVIPLAPLSAARDAYALPLANPERRPEGETRMTTGSPSSADLKAVLRRLKLSRLLDTLPERLTLARQQKMPPQDFLLLVLADEVTRRDGLAATLRAQRARLDPAAQLEHWDPTAKVTFDQRPPQRARRAALPGSHHHVTIVGPVGVGKTFLAHALGHIACRRGHSVLAVRTDQLLKTLKHARLTQSYEAELRKCVAVDLLILDDFGLDAMDAQESRDAYEIFLERHRTGSMVVTSSTAALTNGWPPSPTRSAPRARSIASPATPTTSSSRASPTATRLKPTVKPPAPPRKEPVAHRLTPPAMPAEGGYSAMARRPTRALRGA